MDNVRSRDVSVIKYSEYEKYASNNLKLNIGNRLFCESI